MNLAAFALAVPLFQASPARLVDRARAAPALIRLEPGQPWQRTVPGGARVTCRKGCAWLTHPDDARGVVLLPGDSHLFEQRTRLVAQALLPMEMELVE